MPAESWIDTNGSASDPAAAIAILRGDHSTTDLTGLRNAGDAWWTLSGTDALLMMGTTDELQTTLRLAINQGIVGIQVPDDNMAIWYVRRKAGTFTKSVVSIAPLERYWGPEVTARNSHVEQPGGWYWLWTGTIASNENIQYIILEDLADQVLPRANGVAAWL